MKFKVPINKVFIIKTKILLPRAYVIFADFGYRKFLQPVIMNREFLQPVITKSQPVITNLKTGHHYGAIMDRIKMANMAVEISGS
jgi:hypothetical protein